MKERLEEGDPNSREGGDKQNLDLEGGRGESGGCLPLLSRYPARERET